MSKVSFMVKALKGFFSFLDKAQKTLSVFGKVSKTFETAVDHIGSFKDDCQKIWDIKDDDSKKDIKDNIVDDVINKVKETIVKEPKDNTE